MNALLSWNGGEWWHVAGWTMLHFLWLGALVGLAAGACRFVLRRAEANTRYVVALVSLAVLAALPVGIAAWLAAKPQAMHVDVVEVESPPAELMPSVPVGHPASESAGGPLAESSAPPTIAQTADPRQSGGLAGVDGSPNGALPLAVTMFETAARHLPWLWLVGTPLTFVLLATGVIGAERLRRASCPIKNGPIADTAARLADALQISRQVSLAVCERIAAPVLVGIVRPIILLPPAALTGWSPEEIEMVLLHELAHVRRWDNLVNLAQRCVESLLFFHPAVWLVSNWVRREREACCDAVVVGRTNRPHAYAELLVALAAQMPRSVLFHPGAASAMSAGPLRGRIRRILKLEDDPMLISGKSLGIVMSGLLLAATLVVLNLPSRSRAEESADAGKGRLTTEDTESTEVKQESPKDLQRKLNDIRDRKPVDGTTPDDATEGGVFGARRVGMGGSAPVELNEEAGQRIVDALEKNPAVHSASIRRTPEGRQMLYVDITEPPGTKAFLAWDTDADGRLTCSLKFIDLPSKQSDSGQAKESVDVRKRQPTTKRIKTTEIAESTTATDVVNWLSQFRIYQDLTNEWPPKEIEFDSDLDRDTATLAWYVLRKFDVRVMPATERELQPVRERGYRGGVKVVRQDGRPSILIQLQGEEITSFDDLRKVLIGLVKAKPQVIKFRELIGTQESDYAILRDDVIASRKFPTLEDQKLADLVWARLGLELEPIGEADWKRVQAFGYQGGLRVANRTDRTIGQPLETGDILVGLHVWPTTSLKDVASVLNRDDLAELNPLKYYIVGQQPINERMDDGEVRTVMKDAFETGRISVNLPELAFGSTPTKPRPAVAAAPTDLPYVVPFVVGASRFNDGDHIAITRVRGTREDFGPGSTYWIEGTYTLASRDRASLLASVTVWNADDGKTSTDKDQTMNVERGSGTFALKLPMPYDGWPHVSFYPADSGESFGGIYFGTGDSVLKYWRDVYGSRVVRSAADKWPMDIVFSSPTEGMISERAWKTLGIKLVPATPKESQAVSRQRREIKVLGGVAMPPGLENVILESIHGKTIESFDDVDGILDSLEGLGDTIVIKCLITRDGVPGDVQFLVTPGKAFEAKQPGQAGGKFPSLEDQKLADLIWSRMRGLELEPMGEEDLKRVKALGYEGGLKITSTGSSSIQPDAILVGLHVWPTTSLQQVVDILNRDDLAELNPLKYYVVRPSGNGGDRVASGRISVNLPERTSQSTSTKPRPAVAAAPGATNQSSSLKATAPIDKPNLTYDGKTFDEWRNTWQTELSTEKRLEALKALTAFGANGYGKQAAEAILEVAGQYNWDWISASKETETLKNACVNALNGHTYGTELTLEHTLPSRDVFPVLIDAADSPNKETKAFVDRVLLQFPGERARALREKLSGELSDSARREVIVPATDSAKGGSPIGEPSSSSGIPSGTR